MATRAFTGSGADTAGRLSAAQPAPAPWVDPPVQTLFLLSPAKVSGARAGLLLNPNAGFALAHQFQREGLPLADVFAFSSGLYFRGKITYARHFARPRDRIRVITTNAGLLDPETWLTPDVLRAFGSVDIDAEDPRYHGPLRRDATALARKLNQQGRAVLLGSIATAKYRDVLLDCFGDRLMFPIDFVGRGDMSRGALLLRAARADHELPYVPVAGAVYSGRRATRISEMAMTKRAPEAPAAASDSRGRGRRRQHTT